MKTDIIDWLRRSYERRRAAFGDEGLEGCRYEEAAMEIERLTAERDALRKGIKDYLDGNYHSPRECRPDKCEHGNYWYTGCEACDSEHFAKLLVSNV